MPQSSEIFKAVKEDRVIADADALDNLASKLKKMNVDPRSVRIISSKKLAPIARTGLRGRKRDPPLPKSRSK
jgi:hypothetical protein